MIVPCHNAAGTLAETIESAVAQEGGVEVDIVVVDDGSTDGSLGVATRFEPAVRVLSGPNRGVSAARNRGLAATSGKFVVFLDSDDVLLPRTLERRLDVAEATGSDVVICDWQDLVESGTGPVQSVDFAALEGDAEIACATHVWATPAALMYRRSLVERIRGFRDDLPVIQDARFLFDAAYHGARFAHSQHIGAGYRVRADSLSRRSQSCFWRDVLTNGAQIEALWGRRGAISTAQLTALSDIFNGAAHGLFRAGDPFFRGALAALRASQLPIASRNRLAEVMSDVLGQRAAVRMAALWTLGHGAATNNACKVVENARVLK